jgi:hypothetical protein
VADLEVMRRIDELHLEFPFAGSRMCLSALADLSGQWIDRVHDRRPPRGIVLDMDSSVSPTHGEQESSV